MRLPGFFSGFSERPVADVKNSSASFFGKDRSSLKNLILTPLNFVSNGTNSNHGKEALQTRWN